MKKVLVLFLLLFLAMTVGCRKDDRNQNTDQLPDPNLKPEYNGKVITSITYTVSGGLFPTYYEKQYNFINMTFSELKRDLGKYLIQNNQFELDPYRAYEFVDNLKKHGIFDMKEVYTDGPIGIDIPNWTLRIAFKMAPIFSRLAIFFLLKRFPGSGFL